MHLLPMDHGTGVEGEANPHSMATTTHTTPFHDPLEDVFGADTEAPDQQPRTHNASTSSRSSHHPSDFQRMQREHVTAGYREGLTAAKESSVQSGFDEGFSLGATVALAAGQLFGLLEGIAEALSSTSDQGQEGEVKKLREDARRDLSMERLFGEDFWEGDGNWKYEVVRPRRQETGDHPGRTRPDGAEEQEGEVVFADVADCHPLIQKWTAIVDAQVLKWKIDRRILEDASAPRDEGSAPTSTTMGEEQVVQRDGVVPTQKKPLDW